MLSDADGASLLYMRVSNSNRMSSVLSPHAGVTEPSCPTIISVVGVYSISVTRLGTYKALISNLVELGGMNVSASFSKYRICMMSVACAVYSVNTTSLP